MESVERQMLQRRAVALDKLSNSYSEMLATPMSVRLRGDVQFGVGRSAVKDDQSSALDVLRNIASATDHPRTMHERTFSTPGVAKSFTSTSTPLTILLTLPSSSPNLHPSQALNPLSPSVDITASHLLGAYAVSCLSFLRDPASGETRCSRNVSGLQSVSLASCFCTPNQHLPHSRYRINNSPARSSSPNPNPPQS